MRSTPPASSPRRSPGGGQRIPARRAVSFRLVFTLLVTALALWFLWGVLGGAGLRTLGTRLLSASRPLAALAVVLTVLRYLVLAMRWEVLARREAPVGLSQITPVLMAGNFLSLVTPAVRIAGPILRAYYLSKETGRPRARFYGTIVADQTANFAVYAVVFAVAGAMVTLADAARLARGIGAILMIALIGGLAAGWWVLRDVSRGRPTLVARLLRRTLGGAADGGWRARFILWWEELIHGLAESVIGRRAWWPAMALSVVAYALTVAPQAVAFLAVGERVGLLEISFAVAGAGFAQVMLAAPGGAGITEATLVGVFMALGVEAEPAAAGVFLARLINYAVVTPWGGFAFLSLQRRYGRPVPPPAAA